MVKLLEDADDVADEARYGSRRVGTSVQRSVGSLKTKTLVGVCADYRHDCGGIPTADSAKHDHTCPQECKPSYRELPTTASTLISPSAPYYHYHHN